MTEENKIYLQIWENEETEAEAEALKKAEAEAINYEMEETEFNSFFILSSDNVVYNRNLKIIDSLNHNINTDFKEFKVNSYLSKTEKALIKAIKKR